MKSCDRTTYELSWKSIFSAYETSFDGFEMKIYAITVYIT